MQAGYLVDLRALQVLLQADFDALRTQQGDFVEAELETLLLAADAPAQILAAFQAHAGDRKALLFTPTVALAHAMAETFCAAGIAAEALDGTTPLATRRAILQRLHTGATRVVANCAVLTEGFDEPSVDCIEFIPLSFWYDAPLISPYSDRRHDPWQVYGSPSYSPARWSSSISPA